MSQSVLVRRKGDQERTEEALQVDPREVSLVQTIILSHLLVENHHLVTYMIDRSRQNKRGSINLRRQELSTVSLRQLDLEQPS